MCCVSSKVSHLVLSFCYSLVRGSFALVGLLDLGWGLGAVCIRLGQGICSNQVGFCFFNTGLYVLYGTGLFLDCKGR